ncbi:MAG: hypothetical protein Q7S58_00065, partial [Candidatus Binatus sp.]|uniref:hypothetical protein n=1 Tax=Candidatus Binatus sp. TaxID=2811406 RepID=UPI002715E0FF
MVTFTASRPASAGDAPRRYASKTGGAPVGRPTSGGATSGAFGKKVYADVPPYLVASYFPGKVGQYAPDIGAIPATDLTAQLKSMAA